MFTLIIGFGAPDEKKVKIIKAFTVNYISLKFEIGALDLALAKTQRFMIMLPHISDEYKPVNFYDRNQLLLSKISYLSARAKFVNKKDGIINLYIMNLEYLNLERHIKKYSKYDDVIKKLEKFSPDNEHKYTESIMVKSYDVRYLYPDDEEIIMEDAKNDIELVKRLFKDLPKSKIDSIINAIFVDGFLNCFSEYLMFQRIEDSNSTTHITLTEEEIYNDIIRYFDFECYQKIDFENLNENQLKLFVRFTESEFDTLD